MLSIILHRPIYPRNVGMTARVLANLGVEQLVVVAPQFDLQNETQNFEMRQGAAGAQSVLQNMRVYTDLDTYKKSEGEGLRIAWSAKLGEANEFREVLEKIRNQNQGIASNLTAFGEPIALSGDLLDVNVHLHFGCEDNGMSEQETEFCHFICKLPLNGSFESMNLSHAVMLATYLVREHILSASAQEPQRTHKIENKNYFLSASNIAGHGHNSPVHETLPLIQDWLKTIGFEIDDEKHNMAKKLNRILLSQQPTVEELKVFDAVVRQTVRKLKKL